MTDKALEDALKAAEPELFSDNPEVAHRAASPLKVDVARAGVITKIKAAISAHLSALPGEAEVVGWAYRGPRGGLIVTEEKPEHAPEAVPLVTLDSLQAMQARAEKAEKERDAFRDMADGYGKLDAELAIAEARVKEMEDVLGECKEALVAAEDRDNRARFRANSPRGDAEVVHLRTTAIRRARTALKGSSNG